MDKEPLCEINTDEVVALGASIQAALIAEDNAVEDMVMTDVSPFTLGINISKGFNGRYEGGYYMPIIHRNTTIPVSKEDVVYTIHPNQTTCDFEIYQGEHRKVENNIKLGDLSVTNIPKGPANQPINVRFSYDINGILEVEAFVEGTNKRFKTILTNHVQGLSKEEISEALKKLEQLKFYPRDDENNKYLLLFCEQLLAELNRFLREELEQLVDMYECSLNTNDKFIIYHNE